MKRTVFYVGIGSVCMLAAAAAAQQPAVLDAPAKPTAQSEAGEPRADTSRPRVDTNQSRAGASQSPGGTGETHPSSQPLPSTPPSSTPPSSTHTPGTKTTAAAGVKPSNTADKLQLGAATVTGDREQPKVMYVVPWKKSDIGDLGGKPMNSLVDEILAPVDRDVFKREVSYYNTVKSDASQNGAQSSGQGEK